MKMRGNPELVAVRNVYCVAAVLILISSFAGCAAGSCLSYGHSCWGAHGKRSELPPSMQAERAGQVSAAEAPSYGERWLLSRLVNRQLMQAPLQAAKLRAKLLAEQQQPLAFLSQPLDQESNVPPDGRKHSMSVEKFSADPELRDAAAEEQRMMQGEPSDILLIPPRKDYTNVDDQTIKIGLYKILKNLDRKME